MAISRLSTSRLTQGLPKYQSAWDQENVQQGALVPIGTVVSNGSTTAVQFTNIPQIYQDLRIVAFTRQAANNGGVIYVRLNITNYSHSTTFLSGDGSSATGVRQSGGTDGYMQVGLTVPSNGTTGVFGTAMIDVFDYTSSKLKTAVARSTSDQNGSGGGVRMQVSTGQITSAISSLEFVTDGVTALSAGSTVTLYGIKAGV